MIARPRLFRMTGASGRLWLEPFNTADGLSHQLASPAPKLMDMRRTLRVWQEGLETANSKFQSAQLEWNEWWMFK